jgi:hypothetical protein
MLNKNTFVAGFLMVLIGNSWNEILNIKKYLSLVSEQAPWIRISMPPNDLFIFLTSSTPRSNVIDLASYPRRYKAVTRSDLMDDVAFTC